MTKKFHDFSFINDRDILNNHNLVDLLLSRLSFSDRHAYFLIAHKTTKFYACLESKTTK